MPLLLWIFSSPYKVATSPTVTLPTMERRTFIDTAAQSNLQFDGADDGSVNQQQGFESQVKTLEDNIQTLFEKAFEIRETLPVKDHESTASYDDRLVEYTYAVIIKYLSNFPKLKQEDDRLKADPNYPDEHTVIYERVASNIIKWCSILNIRFNEGFFDKKNAQPYSSVNMELKRALEALKVLFKDNFPHIYALALANVTRGAHGSEHNASLP